MRKQILLTSCALALCLMGFVAGCVSNEGSQVAQADAASSSETLASGKPPVITAIGNGENNYIVLDGVRRDGATFTFQKVVIDQPGWLVIHPFKDGKPAQTVYSGAELLAAGAHQNVAITIDKEPPSGEMFVVMLHYDINEDGVFDFNDGITVPDAPVVEDGTLVALRFAAP